MGVKYLHTFTVNVRIVHTVRCIDVVTTCSIMTGRTEARMFYTMQWASEIHTYDNSLPIDLSTVEISCKFIVTTVTNYRHVWRWKDLIRIAQHGIASYH